MVTPSIFTINKGRTYKLTVLVPPASKTGGILYSGVPFFCTSVGPHLQSFTFVKAGFGI